MQHHVLKVEDEFHEVGLKTVDDRNRLTLGELLKGTKRVRLYRNERGELLLMPMVEIPASEVWLYQNRDALQSVKEGLEDAAKGKISKLNIDEL
ncbi:MAG: hypothetical protein KAW12_23530 [Candidatus Aminicenantes bacterium]|nr:hypothetical protein [Candidatus Aminicenantes bacterium]